jgi:hypothetical protein
MRIVMLLAALALGCCAHVPPPPPGPAAATCAEHVCTCADVCEHGTRLGCDWAEPTERGATCQTVCRNATDPAGPIVWDLDCRAHSATCDVSSCQ